MGGQRWGDSRCSADLTVLDTDPVTAAPEQLDGIGVTRTWVGGTLRYQRP